MERRFIMDENASLLRGDSVCGEQSTI